ncbi:MAG: MFS transporter, partial [Desulfobacteraceae bacterium]|jgi:MFS family permease
MTAISSLLIITFSMNIHLIYFSNFIRGLSDVLILATSYTVASVLIPPQLRGRMFAIFNATFFLSWGLAGTVIAGPIVDYLQIKNFPEAHSYQASFLSAAILTAVGAVLQVKLFLAKKKKIST